MLLSFGHSGLTPVEWNQCLSRLESSVTYFSQDIRRDGAIGAFGWPAPKVGMTQVDKFLVESAKWPSSIPAAFPRFDDIYREAGVGEGYPQLPDDSGRTLQTTLQKALNSKAKILQIATWNDWGEGTQIEPSIEFGYRDLEHMQRVNFNDERRIKKADLRLPITILELRRAKTGIDAQKTLDAISQQIVGGVIDSARQKLEELRSSNGP